MFSPCHCPGHPTREWKQRQSDCLTQPSEMSQMTSESEPEKREQNGEKEPREARKQSKKRARRRKGGVERKHWKVRERRNN